MVGTLLGVFCLVLGATAWTILATDNDLSFPNKPVTGALPMVSTQKFPFVYPSSLQSSLWIFPDSVTMPLPSPTDFESLGRQLAGYSRSTSARIRHERFNACYGVNSIIVSVVWSMLIDNQFCSPSPNPVHILWALLFLKLYDTTPKLAALAGCDEKTFRKWSWFYVGAIASLHHLVVSRCLLSCFSIVLLILLTTCLVDPLPRQIHWMGWQARMSSAYWWKRLQDKSAQSPPLPTTKEVVHSEAQPFWCQVRDRFKHCYWRHLPLCWSC